MLPSSASEGLAETAIDNDHSVLLRYPKSPAHLTDPLTPTLSQQPHQPLCYIFDLIVCVKEVDVLFHRCGGVLTKVTVHR